MWLPRPPCGPPIRHYGDEGLLESSGYQWDERFPPKYLGLGIVAAGALVVAGFVLANMDAGAVIAPIVVAILGTAGCIYFWRCRPTLILHRDGRVTTPYGVPRKPWKRELPVDLSKISHFEAEPVKGHTRVALVTVDGETCVVADELTPAAARLVVVQLSKAMRDLRDSLATLKAAGPAQRIAAHRID